MLNKRFFFWLIFFSSAVVLMNQKPTRASVTQITVQQAQGLSGQIVNLQIPNRDGLNINFIPSGDIIEKVWIDSPTAFSLDVDGCLTHLNPVSTGAAQGANSCSNGAQVLHLKQGKHPRETLLTAVGKSYSNSSRHVYLFKLVPVDYVENYSVDVGGNYPIGTKTYELYTTAASNYQILSRGAAIATQNHYLRPNGKIYQNIQTFLGLVRSGTPIENAAAQSGLSMKLVNSLKELGEGQEFVNHYR